MGEVNLDRWVTPTVRRRVEALAAALGRFDDETRECLPTVMGELQSLLGLDVALSYRVVPAHDGWAFDFLHVLGSVPKAEFVETFGSALNAARVVGAYDPLRPPARQRNAVVLPRQLMDAEAWAASAAGVAERHLGLDRFDEMRALVCHDASVTAWVGGFRTEPFGTRERALLAALTPTLQRRLTLEQQLRSAELSELMLDALLDAFDAAAFIVRLSGHVVHTNRTGRAFLEQPGARKDLRDAVRGAPGYRVVPIDVRGMPPHCLVTIDGHGHDPLECALEQRRLDWKLTRRQTEVLRRIVTGDSNKTIAADLGIALRTVELHASAILEKTHLASRTQLVAAFWRRC